LDDYENVRKKWPGNLGNGRLREHSCRRRQSSYKNPDVVLELPGGKLMKRLNLTTSMTGGILFGFIVAIILFLSPTPPGFAIAGGIIFGLVAFFVLNDRKKEH
jgi:hypothetical protein